MAFVFGVLTLVLSFFGWLFTYPHFKQRRATNKLIQLCKRKGNGYWHPQASEVDTHVKDGADVSVRSSYLIQPILCQFIRLGLVDCVASCLKTQHPIDFTATDLNGNTPFHCVCQGTLPISVVRDLLSLLVYRIETHPRDSLDLNAKNIRGDDFLSIVVRSQLLSALWPLVKHLPVYADQTAPIRLSHVWQWDWEEMEDNASFNPETLIACDKPTAILFKMANEDFPIVEVVEQCVSDGADICFRCPGTYWPILHRFIAGGNIPCVAACLKTSKKIDFTAVDRYDCTPIHMICRNSLDNRASEEEIMSLILQRIEAHREDCVEWGKKNGVGQDFISRAAASERLSLFWPMLKDRVPYFRDFEGPMPIDSVIFRSDWNQLNQDDQLRFKPLRGFE